MCKSEDGGRGNSHQVGIYYMTYVLKNANLLGVFSWAINIPMIVGLLFTPTLVAKWGGL